MCLNVSLLLLEYASLPVNFHELCYIYIINFTNYEIIMLILITKENIHTFHVFFMQYLGTLAIHTLI